MIFFVFISCIKQQNNLNTAFEKDIPVAVPNNVSLAGNGKPDIVRFLKVQSANAPSISPDGNKVAYTSSLTGKPQIWVVNTDKLNTPIQITYGNSVTFHKWSPDNKGILYATDKEGDEKEGYYFISTDGFKEEELLAPSEAYRYFGDFNNEGSQFIYGTTERNGVDFDIHLYDIKNKTDKQVYQGKSGYYPISFSPCGEYIVIAEAKGEDAYNIYLLSIYDNKLTQINKSKDLSTYYNIQWKSDCKSFYMLTNVNREYTGVVLYTIGDKSMKYIIQENTDIEQILLNENTQLLHWVSNDRGYSKHHIYDLAKKVNTKTPQWPEGTLTLQSSKNGETILASVKSPKVPGDIWSWNIHNNEVKRITKSNNAGLNMEDMILPKAHSFKARDGLTVHGLLYSPEQAKANTPLVLYLHGGPTSQSRPSFNGLYQYLIAKGFSVFSLNYRGSTGYGKTYTRENDLRKRENELYDLEDAVNYLAEKNIANKNKIAVIGRSYGGYLSMAAMTRLPKTFQCGVAFVGVSNWITALEDASPDLKASDRYEYGDIDSAEDRAFFESISPIKYIDQVISPVMVLHGANDPRDPVTESDRFVQGIRNNGGVVEYLRFPDEGHGIQKMKNRITAYVRVAEFLEKNLK